MVEKLVTKRSGMDRPVRMAETHENIYGQCECSPKHELVRGGFL